MTLKGIKLMHANITHKPLAIATIFYTLQIYSLPAKKKNPTWHINGI